MHTSNEIKLTSIDFVNDVHYFIQSGSSLSLTAEAIFDDVTRSSNQTLHLSSEGRLKTDVVVIGGHSADNNGNGSDITDDDESGVVPGSNGNRSKVPSKLDSVFPVSSAASAAHLDSPSVVEELRHTGFGASHRRGSVDESASSSSSSNVVANSGRFGRPRCDFVHRLSTATMDSSSNDDRKRPLSVSSTSSTSIASSSASSSLSRHHHQRKKMATNSNYNGDSGDVDCIDDYHGCAEEERDDEELEHGQEGDYSTNTGCLSTVAEYSDLPPTALVAAVTELRSATGTSCVVGIVDNRVDCVGESDARARSVTPVDVSMSSSGLNGIDQTGNSFDSYCAAADSSCQSAADEMESDTTLGRVVSHRQSASVSVSRLSTESGGSNASVAAVLGRGDITPSKMVSAPQATAQDSVPTHCGLGVGMATGSGSGSGVGGGSGSSTGLLRQVMSQSQYIHCVLSEIVDTERAYINDLRQIIEVCSFAGCR